MATLTHNANTSKHVGCQGFNYDHAAAREECRKDSAATLNRDLRQLADDLKALAMLGQQAVNAAVALRHGQTPGDNPLHTGARSQL